MERRRKNPLHQQIQLRGGQKEILRLYVRRHQSWAAGTGCLSIVSENTTDVRRARSGARRGLLCTSNAHRWLRACRARSGHHPGAGDHDQSVVIMIMRQTAGGDGARRCCLHRDLRYIHLYIRSLWLSPPGGACHCEASGDLKPPE